MVRSLVSKVMWVGRATVFLVGLAVILALTVGVVSRATAHTGSVGLFHLGHSNPVTTLSSLVGTVSNGMLQVTNNSTATTATGVGVSNRSPVSPAVRATNQGGGPALGLNVTSGKAPMTVSSGAAKVTNLDADTIDGLDSSQFAAANKVKGGRLELPVPATSGAMNTGTVFETNSFKIQGRCTNLGSVDTPSRGELALVGKETISLAARESEGGSAKSLNLEMGRPFHIAGAQVDARFPSDSSSYGRYVAEASGGFLEGQGAIVLEGGKCRFSATGLGA